MRFAPLFRRWARRVRARLALRHALTGAALGLALAMVPAALAWRTRHGALRLVAPVVGALGAVVGLARARRARWSDTDVALYLDDRLETEETIATAVELQRGADAEDAARAVVITRATAALASRDARRARPPFLRPVHALAPLAALALVAIARAPLPAARVTATLPGAGNVQMKTADGLEKIAQLAQVDARDDAQRERLKKLAKDAQKLKEELAAGLAKRDAQDRIARIEDALAEERLSLGAGEKRAGMESAVGKLEESELTKKAGKALGDHDLERMDAELERLANQREKADRALAKKALEDAKSAANKGGAPDVGKALGDAESAMDRRGARADALRDLAEAMDKAGMSSDELRAEAEALDRKGTDAAAKKLAESMREALEKLTPKERRRLADKLRKMQKEQANRGQGGDTQDLKDLADDLSTPEGQKRLEDRLRDMANDDTESDEAKRQRALDGAQQGAEDTEKGLGSPGAPQPGEKPGGQGPGAGAIPVPGRGQGQGQGDGQGGAGSHHDVGTGDHTGKTNGVDAQTLKSRAKGPMNRGPAMPGTVSTFSQGRGGGTATTRGTGDLRVVGPSEVDGVNKSDVPEEYRDQVRHYFQP